MMQGDTVMWLVMVKDVKGRFVGNANWGSGWGWAAFRPSNLKKNLSADYKRDCLGCHEAAKATDLVFSEGYPVLIK
jgi:cytochrome c